MPSPRDPSWRLKGFARQMRHESTDAERKIWSHLRDRQLNGYKFRRQVPIAGCIVDYYCLKKRLIIELDGGQHFDASGKRYDAARDDKLRSAGNRILRYTDVEVLKDTDIVLADILRHLEEVDNIPSSGIPGEG